jgi:hypothetical protein
MNRRQFFQLLLGAFAVATFQKKLAFQKEVQSGTSHGQDWGPEAEAMRQRRLRNELYPLHECVDGSHGPCPACVKWGVYGP